MKIYLILIGCLLFLGAACTSPSSKKDNPGILMDLDRTEFAANIMIDLRGKLWLSKCQEFSENYKNETIPHAEVRILLDGGPVDLSCEELRDILIGASERKKRVESPTK